MVIDNQDNNYSAGGMVINTQDTNYSAIGMSWVFISILPVKELVSWVLITIPLLE